ncbi:MAG: serine/threonine protein kinase [Deltaproteobacteria bacterium]|nr:serine/threonine protein kinase [Deltaproteobacteria bacterium]
MTETSDSGSYDSIVESLRLQGTGVDAPIHRTIRPISGAAPAESLDIDDSVPRQDPIERQVLNPHELPLLVAEQAADALILGGLLGKGGAGLVQEAWQPSLARQVAVKRIRQRPASTALVDSLIEEARLSGSLEHPNILPVHELGRSEEGEPLLVMQKVRGTTWEDLLDDPSHPSWASWRGERLDRHLQIIVQVCHALEFAHDRGVLHLDLKPANIMLGAYGEVWLMDWGVGTRLEDLAKLPKNQVVGTPAFMAPEMLIGRHCSERRTDVFLLGAVLHQVLTGRFLYRGDRLETVLMAALRCEPPTFGDDVPAGLGQICRRACRKEEDERFPSVAAFRMAVEDFVEHRGAQRLIEAATLQLEELERVLDATGADSVALQRGGDQIAGTASRARFGFEQALIQWPGNSAARAGLQNTLERTISFELDRNNVTAVAALLDALPVASPSLRARYTAARKALDADLDARAKLDEIARENRFEEGDWKRSIGMLTNGTAWAIGLLAWGRALQTGVIENPEMVNFGVAVFGTVVSLTVVFLLRGLFLDNRMRRGFTAAYCLFIVALDLNRLAALFMDIPFTHTFMTDHVVLIMFMGVLAAFVAPTLWWATGTALLGMLATMLWPEPMFGIAAVELFAVNAIVGWALRPRSAGGRFD